MRQAWWLLLVVAVSGTARGRPFPEAHAAAAPVVSVVPADSVYRSGARLKIRWAEAPSPEVGVRVPFALFDAELHRECALSKDGRCIPVADRWPFDDDLAFLDRRDPREVALRMPTTACSSITPDEDDSIWTIPSQGEPDTRYRLGAPRLARDAWTASGSGCTPSYETLEHGVCVRPFELIDMSGIVATAERGLGSTEGREWVVVTSPDGAVVPRRDAVMYGDTGSDPPAGGAADSLLPGEEWLGQGRIVLRALALTDGTRVPLSLHDAHLGRDCTPRETDDGVWRCTVALPTTCSVTTVGDGETRRALTPSASFCATPERCCEGGTYWFPGHEAYRVRFGIGGPGDYAAERGRALRFSSTPRRADHVHTWQADRVVRVYDLVEELDPTVFAELRIVEGQ